MHFAAAGVGAGHYELGVAAGASRCPGVPMGSTMTGNPLGERYVERYGATFPNQGIGPEMIAAEWRLSGQQLDEYSLASHEKAAAAQDDGRLEARSPR